MKKLILILFPFFTHSLIAADTKTIIHEDFTGDGIRDLAIWKMDNGKVATWGIYRGQKDGKFHFAYTLDFHPKAFRIYSSQQGTEFVMYHAGGAGKGMLVTFQLNNQQATQTSKLEIEAGDGAGEAHKKLYKEHFGYLWIDPRTETINSSRIVDLDGVITFKPKPN